MTGSLGLVDDTDFCLQFFYSYFLRLFLKTLQIDPPKGPGRIKNNPNTSLGGPFLGFKKSRSRGREEKLRQKKAKIRKKKKH